MGLCLGLALVLATAVAWGQDRRQPAGDSFRVTWQPRATGVVPTIEGRVHNASLVWVTDVRLQVDGLDPEGHGVGRRFAWVLGDIVPGGESSFVVDAVRGAAGYRITVVSFSVVSVTQAP
jgi:hypothetical protein